MLAINELVTNSVQYGGGGGTLRIWTRDPASSSATFATAATSTTRSSGALPPPLDQHGGRGLWLVNHLCDLVQIRSTPKGTIVRVHMRIGADRPADAQPA